MDPLTDATCGTISLGGARTVRRLGYGAMRLTGEGVWGPPRDPDGARALLRRVIDAGVNLIDTADAYGPDVNETLIADALRPYPDDLVIATKGGLVRQGPGQWSPDGRPDHLRAACEGSLTRLGVDTIDLYQLHRPDPAVPFAESVGAIAELVEAGKVRLVGLSNVSVDQLREAQSIVAIASVQNRYNLRERDSEDVLRACEADGIAFLPYFPLGGIRLHEGHLGPDRDRRGPRRGARHRGPRMAAGPLAGDAPHSRYGVARPPRREPRRGGTRPRRGRSRAPRRLPPRTDPDPEAEAAHVVACRCQGPSARRVGSAASPLDPPALPARLTHPSRTRGRAPARPCGF